jgi:hypothetical protein
MSKIWDDDKHQGSKSRNNGLGFNLINELAVWQWLNGSKNVSDYRHMPLITFCAVCERFSAKIDIR